MNSNARTLQIQPRRNRSRRLARGNSIKGVLTGGTQDVKPQILSFLVAQSGNDTTTTQSQSIPVLRNYSSGPGKAQVVEILKVYFLFSPLGTVTEHMMCALSTKDFATTTVSPPDRKSVV